MNVQKPELELAQSLFDVKTHSRIRDHDVALDLKCGLGWRHLFVRTVSHQVLQTDEPVLEVLHSGTHLVDLVFKLRLHQFDLVKLFSFRELVLALSTDLNFAIFAL